MSLAPLFVGQAATYVTDPTDCPTVFQSQNCLGNTQLCGYDNNIVYCYDNSTLTAPGSNGSGSNISGALGGGYLLDCEAYDGSTPFCGTGLCNEDGSCSSVNRETVCNANSWGSFSCGSCKAGYTACDGSSVDVDGCEVQNGITAYPGEANSVYTSNGSCGVQCASGYTDCNGDLGTGGDGCEIQNGVTAYPGEANAVYTSSGSCSFQCSAGYSDCNGDLGTGGDGCEVQGSCGGGGGGGADNLGNHTATQNIDLQEFWLVGDAEDTGPSGNTGLQINADGKVSIGTTSAFSDALNVDGDINLSAGGQFKIDGVPISTGSTQGVITNQGLTIDGNDDFGLVGCNVNQILVYTDDFNNDTVTDDPGWRCEDQRDLDLTGDILSLDGGTTTVDLSTYTDNAIQNVTTDQGLIRDGSNNFGLIGCATGEILKYTNDANGDTTIGDFGWICATDDAGGGGATTENDLETQITDVTDIYTNLDGNLDDDDLTDNNLSDLADVSSCADGEILQWNNGTSSWDCVTESDPSIGTLTAGRWCTTDGNTIECTALNPGNDDDDDIQIKLDDVVFDADVFTLDFSSAFSLTTDGAFEVDIDIDCLNITGSLGLCDGVDNDTQYDVSNDKGLERIGNNFGLISSCADGELLKWNLGTSSWVCASDNDSSAATLCAGGEYLDGDGNCYPIPVDTTLTENEVEAFIDGDETSFDDWDKNVLDDFSGDWGDLANIPADIADGDDDTTYGVVADRGLVLTGTNFGLIESCGNNEILKWDGVNWICSVDDAGGDDWGADVVISDATLSGDGTAGDVLTLAQQGATADQVLKWNGSAWVPANDETFSGSWNDLSDIPADITDGDDDTNAGTLCATGELLDGDGNCVPIPVDTDTTYDVIADRGLELVGTEFGLIDSCADDQVLSWDNGTSAWVCADQIDTDTTYGVVANRGIALTGTDFGLIESCGNNEILKWDGANWICSVDADTDTTLDETAVDAFVANNGYLTAETDPVFTAHVSAGITNTQITNWDTAFSWGNHATQNYYDKDTDDADDIDDSASTNKFVTQTLIDNWNNAFSWGDHASEGYLTQNQTITLSGHVTGSGETAITTTIASGVITESMIDINNAPTDEYCLTFESGGSGDFEWQSCASAGGDDLGSHSANQDLDMNNNAILDIDWSGSDMGNGSGLDADLLDGLHSTAFCQSDGTNCPVKNIATQTANYTATTSDQVILCDATSGDVTITLPLANTMNGREITVKRIDSSGNTCFIEPNIADLLDNSATAKPLFTPLVSVHTISDGTNWWIQ